MAADPRSYFTLDQYLAIVKAEGPILEYWDGDILMMSGGSREHLLISNNTHEALMKALSGGPCRVFGEGAATDTPTLPTFRFPDCVVVCGQPIFRRLDGGTDVITNPTLIVEVLSPTSATYDHGRKFEAYKSIPTFREYLLIEQSERKVTRWLRDSSEKWSSTTTTDGVIRLKSLDCDLEMADIYEGVEL